MKKTIKQIADLAGVSPGTVDRVLHNRYGVNPNVRQRVQKILIDIDYKPNVVAKALKRSGESINFGYIVTDLKNPFWNGIIAGFNHAKKEYESHGVTLKQIDMKEISAEEQVRRLDELLGGSEKMNGVFIGALNSPIITDYINDIAGKIPVITYNTDVNGSKRLCFVGQNHMEAGHVAGRLMSLLLHRDGKIVTFSSHLTTLAHVNRFHGFKKSIERLRPDSIVLDAIRHIETDEAGYEAALEALKIPDVTALYVTGEGSSGIAKALKESGLRPNVKMICFDMLDGIVEAVKDEIIDFTIGQNEYLQGYLPVKLMYEYLVFGTPPPSEKIYTDIDIRVKENIGNEDFFSLYL